MTLPISITFPQSNPNPVVKTLRRYGDPVMVELMGLTTIKTGPNFQNIDLWTVSGGFGAVSNFQTLDRQAFDYLKALQPSFDGTLREKLNWLIGEGTQAGRPYWTRGAGWDGNWTSFEFGTILFGGQQCLVEETEYTFLAKYQSRQFSEMIPFYKLIGMRFADRGKYSHATHPWFIQQCTAADKDNRYTDTPRAMTHYHPVWSAEDYPKNGGARELFVAKAFLET